MFLSGQQAVAFLCAEVQSSFILLLHHPPELWSPTFLPPGTGFVEDNFSMDWSGRDGFRMIQEHYIYCALYFYYYYISSISDHLELDPIGWGPLPYSMSVSLII